jgi:hypothetical protein
MASRCDAKHRRVEAVSKPARKNRTTWAVMSSSSHSVVRTQNNKQFDTVPQIATLSHKADPTNGISVTKSTPQKQKSSSLKIQVALYAFNRSFRLPNFNFQNSYQNINVTKY